MLSSGGHRSSCLGVESLSCNRTTRGSSPLAMDLCPSRGRIAARPMLKRRALPPRATSPGSPRSAATHTSPTGFARGAFRASSAHGVKGSSSPGAPAARRKRVTYGHVTHNSTILFHWMRRSCGKWVLACWAEFLYHASLMQPSLLFRN